MGSTLRTLQQPGSIEEMAGDFTQLAFMLAGGLLMGDQAKLENTLGYGRGRLEAGYWLLLLTEQPQPGDVTVAGWTSQSGGRVGLPAVTDTEDQARLLVSKTFRAHRHEEIDRNFALSLATRDALKADSDAEALEAMANNVDILGILRAAKIFPATDHQDGMSPADQYPPGEGASQYKLHKKLKWFVAAQVQPGEAWIVPPTWPPAHGLALPGVESYEDRAAIRKKLETA